MIRKFLFVWMACMPVCLMSQVTVNVQLPPAGMVQKDQLWSLLLVNNGKSSIETTVLLTLQDAVTGQQVLTASTRSVFLGKGLKMLAMQDIQPIQYNYSATDFSGNYLPLGSYIACYTVSGNTSKGPAPLANECIRINIKPLSPPLLNTPTDKSVIHTAYPQLTWVPPAPLDLFSDLNYDLFVTEVAEGQSPLDAILHNTPVYTNNHLKAPFETFPSTYVKLEKNKVYAWQVIARNGLNYSAATEVWTFSLGNDSTKVQLMNTSYIQLKNDRSGTGMSYITGNDLAIKYYSFDKDHETAVRLFTSDKKLVQELKRKIKYGDNFINLNLSRSFVPGQVYIVEITDEQNKTYSASFSIQ
jgi:hypothetical protein